MTHEYQVKLLSEYEIDTTTNTKIARLLDECFPDVFEGRSFFKQLPHFRYVAFAGNFSR